MICKPIGPASLALMLVFLSHPAAAPAQDPCNSASVNVPLPEGTGVYKIHMWRVRDENSLMTASVSAGARSAESHTAYLESGHDRAEWPVVSNEIANGALGKNVHTGAKGIVYRNGKPKEFGAMIIHSGKVQDGNAVVSARQFLFYEYCNDPHPNTIVYFMLRN